MNQKIAFVFPGQGSQSLGMLASLALEYEQIQATFDEASDVLGLDLWRVVQQGPEDQLNQTHVTQPAILAASVAIWRVWQSLRLPAPIAMAGHSLGEYSALVCAKALSFADAIALVAQRGRIMQDAVPAGIGAMAAIVGLNDETVSQVCGDAAQGQVVAPVNFNSPGQVVIAGHRDAVERAMLLAKEAKAKMVVALNVSVPSHCVLMEPAAHMFGEQLKEVSFGKPKVSVIHNVDVQSHHTAISIRHALERQLYSPVRWTETIEKMAQQGVEKIFECGPGKVLTGLTKRINKAIKGYSLQDIAQFDAALQALQAYDGASIV